MSPAKEILVVDVYEVRLIPHGVKIVAPASDTDIPDALVSNKDRSTQVVVSVNETLKAMLGDEKKAYFHGFLRNGEVHILEKVTEGEFN